MYLNGTCNKVCVNMCLVYIQNCLKQGGALSPLFLNFILEYVIRKVRGIIKLQGSIVSKCILKNGFGCENMIQVSQDRIHWHLDFVKVRALPRWSTM